MAGRAEIARAVEIAIVEKTMHHPIAEWMPHLEWLWPHVADAIIALDSEGGAFPEPLEPKPTEEIEMMRATVSTAVLATLTTGIVMVDGFALVYEAAEAVVGYPLFTHELGAAQDRIRYLVRQQLPGFPVEAMAENWHEVRDAAIAQFGETVEIERGTDKRAAHPLTTLDAAITEARDAQ